MYIALQSIRVAAVIAGVALLLAIITPATWAQTTRFSTQLEFGDSGPAVTQLQTFLANDPTLYPEGLVTGFYGSLTTAAVQRFQCRLNIVCSGTPATTGFGRVGPLTLASLNTTGGTGGPVGPDLNAPIMSNIMTTMNDRNFTVTWTTNESARGKVYFNTTFPWVYISGPQILGSTFGLNHSITVSGLNPNTRYFYVAESADAAGNLMWSVPFTVVTATSTTTGGATTTVPVIPTTGTTTQTVGVGATTGGPTPGLHGFQSISL